MATELTVQSERAFQKQPHIFLNNKSKAKSSKVGKGGRRWYKDVGLGFRTPKTAIEGNYIGRSIFWLVKWRDRHVRRASWRHESMVGGHPKLSSRRRFIVKDEKFRNIRSEKLTQNSHR
jgi:hypothetical protein